MLRLMVALLWLLCVSGCKDDPPPQPITQRTDPAIAASQALSQARSAAKVASRQLPANADPCRRARQELIELAKHDPAQPSPAQDFLAQCRALPAAVQLCLRIGYALDHAAECYQALAALPPAQRQRANRLITQN